MTIPRRADLSPGDSQAAARIKLLAELPHVGEEPTVVPVTTYTQKKKSSHPAFAEQAAYGEKPVFDSLHTRTTRYVDHAHVDDEWEGDELERYEGRRRLNQPLIQHQRQKCHRLQAKPGLGGLLSQVHQQLAPFAGLIVTAALVATAVLLFHMMTGDNKSNADLNDFALPGFQVDAIESPALPEQDAPLADASSILEIDELQTVDPRTTELQPGKSEQEKSLTAEVSTQSSPPLADTNIAPTTPLGQLLFPQTGTPLALDYSKATDPDLQKLPEVAERTEATAAEGINR